jgi:RNA polymerase-associated protein LEO1
MQLGSDLYDLAPSYGTTLARPSDPAPKNPLPTNAPGTDTTFLVQANDESGMMMTENSVAGHLSLVPASSSSKTHIELVRHVGQQHVKHSRMKVLDEIVDPEKAFVVQNTKKKPAKRSGGGGGGRGGGARKKADSSDDEDDDPRFTYDTDLPGGRGRPPRGTEAEYEDDGFVIADSDDEEAEEEEEGEDDAAYGSSKRSKSKKSKSKKRKGSEEMDEMEIAEKRIEAAEREKKRAKRDRNRRRAYDTEEDEAEGGEADGDGEEDMEMDVESD